MIIAYPLIIIYTYKEPHKTIITLITTLLPDMIMIINRPIIRESRL